MISFEKAKKIESVLLKDEVQNYVHELLDNTSCITEESREELFSQVAEFYNWSRGTSAIKTSCNIWSSSKVIRLLNGLILSTGESVAILLNDLILE